MALLRYLKLRSLLREDTPLADFMQMAFFRDGLPDQELSVYKAAPEQAQQVVAEHSASFSNPPAEDTAGLLDLDGLVGASQLVQTTGKTRFVFTQAVHHDVVSSGPDKVIDLATRAWLQRGDRNHSVDPEAVRGYACSRMRAADPEWTCLVDESGKRRWKKWLSGCDALSMTDGPNGSEPPAT